MAPPLQLGSCGLICNDVATGQDGQATLTFGFIDMYSKTEQQTEKSVNTEGRVTDDLARLETLLDALDNGQLNEWINELAQMAVAEHMKQMAQEIQSTIEAEDSNL